MMRNAGESMGVFASVDMVGRGDHVPPEEDELLFSSRIDVVSLHEMETLIAGEAPFSGLRSPRWPTAFPSIDEGLAAEGAIIYEERCAGCHLPAPSKVPEFYDDRNWTPEDAYGNRYLALPVVNLWTLGTDPLAAVNFYRRVVELGPLGHRLRDDLAVGGRDVGGQTTAGVALPLLIEKTVEKRYDELGIPEALREHMNGYRDNDIQAPMGYRARPLNGVWATPPYLHNGSVPNLFHLLGPAAARPDTFYLGSRRFDPDSVGVFSGPLQGGFLFDASISGNSNEGHSFEGCADAHAADCQDYWKDRKGVIGPALEEDERWAVIEYLKQLPPLPAPPAGR
jgi:hypothetical protein